MTLAVNTSGIPDPGIFYYWQDDRGGEFLDMAVSISRPVSEGSTTSVSADIRIFRQAERENAMNRFVTVLSLVIVLVVCERVSADFYEFGKLTASDGEPDDHFGISVGVSRDYAVVGAYQDDDKGDYSGSAYVFQRSGTSWLQQVKLFAGDGKGLDYFGCSVSISDDIIVVGARQGDDGTYYDCGAAYVFERIGGSSWAQTAKLVPTPRGEKSYLGYSVAVCGRHIIAGAVGVKVGRYDEPGAAYVFYKDSGIWVQQAQLFASDWSDGDGFGVSVAISGDYAVVGAPFKNGASGAAYVFKRSGTQWLQQAKLTDSDGNWGDFFGYSVAISGDSIIVGAYQQYLEQTGAAFIFVKSADSSWSQQAELKAGDGYKGDYFGQAVAISGDRAVVGARHNDSLASESSGAAYIFRRSGTSWLQEAKLVADEGHFQDWFGSSVAIYGGYALIGAYLVDNPSGTNSGAAYMFGDGDLVNPGCPACSGTGASIQNYAYSPYSDCVCSSEKIDFGPNVTVPNGSKVVLKAKKITFKAGVTIEEGADFKTGNSQ